MLEFAIDIILNAAAISFFIFFFLICSIVLIAIAFTLYDINGYSPRFSFNKELNKKMRYYPVQQRMIFLKLYMNFFCPFFTLSAVTTNCLRSAYPESSYSILLFALLCICVFNVVAVRYINPFGFYSSLICLPIISVLNIVNAIMDLYANTLFWPFLILSVLSMLFYIIITIITFICYTKRKPLFFKSFEQLETEYLESTPAPGLEEMRERYNIYL